MTMLREWAVALCTVGIGCAFLRMLCPKGALRRTFGALTATAFLCCLITPLGSIGTLFRDSFDVAPSSQVPTALNEATQDRITMIIEDALVRDAAARLASFDVTVKKATVVRDTAQQDSIYIERVKLTFDKADHPLDGQAVAVLERAWGTVVEVQYSG